MLRTVRKTISLLLIITFIFTLSSPAFVSAATNKPSQTAVLHSAYGCEISTDLYAKLTEYAPSQEISSRSSGFGGEMDIFHNDSVVFSWAVLYDIENLDYYVRPLHAQFICYFDESRYSVTNANLLYETNGYECDNQYNPIDGRPWYQEHIEYLHIMEINRATVRPRTYQTTSNAYRSDRLICITPGHHTVDVVFYLNGIEQFDFWDLTIGNWG